jgi:hypothetical protein
LRFPSQITRADVEQEVMLAAEADVAAEALAELWMTK